MNDKQDPVYHVTFDSNGWYVMGPGVKFTERFSQDKAYAIADALNVAYYYTLNQYLAYLNEALG